MASFAQAFRQLREMYAQLSLGKKISFFLIFTLLFASFMGLVWWAGQPEFRILYTDLTADDANAVVTHLKENKISYQLSQGGTAISVPADGYYDARMSLANAGLPSGGSIGFELFDRKGLGLSNFQMKVAYLRALQGELSRTIQQLSTVDAVRVHLVMPDKALFEEDQKDTTASVVLKLAANARLNEDQVQGIVFLISSSVEGLKPGNVTIINSKGSVLSKRTDQASGADIADKARKMERELEQRIVSLLARSVGPEKVAAKITVLLDNQQVQKVIEEYDPEAQVVRSEEIVTSENQDSDNTTSAFPGAESNLPESSYQEGRNQQSKGQKRQETINYEISRTTSTIMQTAGAIVGLSIAVLIDGTYQEETDEEGTKTKKYIPRGDEEMAAFTDLIKKAVGFNKDRGDQIKVANIAFATEGVGEEESLISDRTGFYIRIMNYVLAVLGLLLFIVFVLRPMVRWLTSEASIEKQLGMSTALLQGATVGELEAQLGASAGERMIGRETGEETKEGLKDKMGKLEQQRANLLDTASRDPQAVTLMVKRWLKEEDGGQHG